MDTATTHPSVFVSYNQADRQWAEWIAWTLEEAGHRVVIQAWDFRPGSNFVLEMQNAAAGTDKTLVVLSDNYLGAEFTQPEWAAAFARDPQGRDRTLVPARIAPCSPKGLLGPIVWVDLVGLSETAARDRLLQAFAERGKPLLAPAFPGAASPTRVAPAAVPFPGNPPLHNLPYPRLGDLFTGRQEELDALAAGGTAAITQSAAISGLGGIGKTRLAVEYAWRSGNRYTAAWFVRADSPENLRRNLAALAGPELLNLPEWASQVEDKTVAAVKRELREHPGWLMILDNVDTPEAADAVLEALPSLAMGRVLITSRLTTWPAGVRMRSLYTLSSEEATHFLLRRTDGGREKAEDDGARACELTQLLDGLPLALEQAAAYIIRHRMRFAEYLRTWEQEHDKLLQWYDPRVMQYPASVAVTWKQTFDLLSPTPAALLRLTAFLAPDPIPFGMLEQGAEHVNRAAELFCEEVGTAADGKTVREATADLADYSLITRQDGGMLVVHRMVQEALRSQIPAEHRRDWIEGALRIVNDTVAGEDPSDVRTWPVWDRLRPHVAEVVSRADEVGVVEPTSRLMNDLGLLLWAKGIYSEAEPWLRRALNIDEATFGPQHPNVAIRLNNLAWVIKETNRFGEAEPLMRRALEIDEAYFGNKHPSVAIDLNNLVWLLKGTNRLEEAEPLMRRALEIFETSRGPQHHVAIALNNLALLFKTTNRLEEAEPLMRRALDIDEAYFGDEHPNVARDRHNLALLLEATNRLREAEPLMRRAFEIYEKRLGPEHPWTRNMRRTLEILLAKIAAAAPGEADGSTAPEAP